MNRELIYLSDEEAALLKAFRKNSHSPAMLVRRARVLMLLDRSNKKDHLRIKRISDEVGISRQAIYDIWDDYLKSSSISEFLTRRQREKPPIEPKITGDVEAKIIALACSSVPEGYNRWSLRLLASKAVELQIIESISFKSVQLLLKKRNISLT